MLANRKRTSNLPSTLRGLRAWFRASSQGRTLFGRLGQDFLEEKCQTCQGVHYLPKVLVVLRRLGNHAGAEVYAESGTNIRLLELPDVPDEAGFEELTERLILARLPRNWQGILNLPAKQIQSDVFRGVSVEEALRFQEELQLIRELRQ